MSSPKIRWNKPRCHPSDSETKNVPCARSGHTLSVIGNTGFLFGGLSAGLHDKIARPLNELHILKMGSSEFEWCLLELDGQKLWQGGVILPASMTAPKSLFLEDTIQPLSVCQMCGCSTLSPWSGSSRILIKILVLSLMVVILHQALGQVFLPLVEVILQLLLGIQCSYLAVMAATVQFGVCSFCSLLQYT